MVKDKPDVDEFVIATVKKIMPYGAFCTLDEYGEREAFIHISEVASRWVRAVSEFVKEGQKIVARVHRINAEKDQIDLSLRRVSEQDKRRKLDAWQHEKRAHKLLEQVAKELKAESDLPTIESTITEHCGDLYAALEDVVITGPQCMDGIDLPDEWKKAIIDIATKAISKPIVVVDGTLVLQSWAPDGVQHVQASLQKLLAHSGGDVQIVLKYISAPKYAVQVTGPDYKRAEAALADGSEAAINYVTKHGGAGELQRAK